MVLLCRETRWISRCKRAPARRPPRNLLVAPAVLTGKKKSSRNLPERLFRWTISKKSKSRRNFSRFLPEASTCHDRARSRAHWGGTEDAAGNGRRRKLVGTKGKKERYSLLPAIRVAGLFPISRSRRIIPTCRAGSRPSSVPDEVSQSRRTAGTQCRPRGG